MRLNIELPPELAEQIALQVAELLADQVNGPADPDRLMTVAEAAEYVRARPHRIYDLVAQGRFPVERDGKRVLIRKAELDRYLGGAG